MLIDLILDRRDGQTYNPAEFLAEVKDYAYIFDEYNKVAIALESGNEALVQWELTDYVSRNGYGTDICDYINAVEWTC